MCGLGMVFRFFLMFIEVLDFLVFFRVKRLIIYLFFREVLLFFVYLNKVGMERRSEEEKGNIGGGSIWFLGFGKGFKVGLRFRRGFRFYFFCFLGEIF